MDKKREMSESGMLVYPKLPVPKQSRDSDARLPPKPRSSGSKLVPILLVIALLAGAAAGFLVRPLILEDSRVVEAENALAKSQLALAEAQQANTKLQEDSKKLDEQRDLLNKELAAAKQAQDMLADKQADAAKQKADLEAVKKKLAATGAGPVTIHGDEVHVVISDAKLFKSGDDLSPGGTRTLDKVADALKELANKQIAVRGHTDDQPPPRPKPPKPSKKDKDKDKPPAPPPELATNWELSSARALAVVHYLQDKHKIEGTRLSAQAFSQYQPISKNRAANRRVELVLTTKVKK